MKVSLQKHQSSRDYIYYAQICHHNQQNDEDVEVEYEIERIQNHRFKPSGSAHLSLKQIDLLQRHLNQIPDQELQFLVKWAGLQQYSWQPGQNLKNAPQILESYKKNYLQTKSMNTGKGPGKRGRKPKNLSTAASTQNKTISSGDRNFSFSRVYRKRDRTAKEDDDDDDIFIIDKADYLKGTRETPTTAVVEVTKHLPPDLKIDQKKLIETKPQENPIFIHQNIENARGLDRESDLKSGNSESSKKLEQNPSTIQYQSKQDSGNSLNHPDIEHEVRPINDRSLMITQQEKTPPQIEEKITQKPLDQIQQEKPASEYCQSNQPIIQSSISPGQRLIDLFLQKEKKSIPPNEEPVLRLDQPQPVYWPANEQFSIEKSINAFPSNIEVQTNIQGKAHEEHQHKNNLDNIPPFEPHNHQQNQNSQIISPKRLLSQALPQEQPIQNVSKKIKQFSIVSTEPIKQQIPQQTNNFVNCESHRQPIIIDIEEDSVPHLVNNRLNQQKSLKQRIQDELHILLNQEKINIVQILKSNLESKQLPPKPAQRAKQISKPSNEQPQCKKCQSHQSYNNQLRLLFNQLLESTSIDFDTLFLQQETFSVLTTLNPNVNLLPFQKYLRTDKMSDISGNEPLCTLISRKIVKIENIEEFLSDWKLSKLIKIHEQWFGIFEINRLGLSKCEHFKYVRANQILKNSRDTIVSFLMR